MGYLHHQISTLVLSTFLDTQLNYVTAVYDPARYNGRPQPTFSYKMRQYFRGQGTS